MSMFSSFMHPGRGYQDAQDQLDKYYGQAQQGYQPYMERGGYAGGQLQSAMDILLNPKGLQDEWMNSYETSPQAKWAQEQAKQQGLDTAGSMGLMGSQSALQAIQGGMSNIGMQDKQNYLQDLMDKYKTGVGLGENIYGTGANMAGQSGRDAMQMGQNSAEMAYGKASAPGQLFGNLLNTGINSGTSYLTGGMGTGGFGRGAWSTGG